MAALTRSTVATAVSGRAFLLRLRPEDAGAAAVTGALTGARSVALERAAALGKDVEALRVGI